MMENLVQRVRHENLRLDVDAGRVARQILAKRVYDHAPVKYPVNEKDAKREKRAANVKDKTLKEDDEKAGDPEARAFAVASAAA